MKAYSAITVFFVSFLSYIFIFLSVYLTGINDLTLQSEDFLAVSTLPFSIIKERNLDLNEYYETLTSSYPQPDDSANIPYYLFEVNGKYYSNYPMFTGFFVTPIYILPAIFNLDNNIETIRIMSRLGGALITAFSVALFYKLLQTRLDDIKKIYILLFIYAFASNTLSISSQGLWQQSTTQFLLAGALLSLYNKKIFLTGLLLGFAYAARPTNIFSTGLIGLYILVISQSKIKDAFLYGIGAVIPILLDMSINYSIFGTLLNAEYGDRFHEFNHNLFTGIAGLWLSPSKGVLILTPIFIFIFYGIWFYLKNWKSNLLEVFIIAIVVIHTIVLGKWYSWWGGYGWGYRMMTELIPYFVLLLIPFITSKYFQKKFWKYLFYVLTGISFGMQLLGIIFFDSVWHTIFDGKPGWLWSINNSQIVFSIKRGLYKFGLIGSPHPLIKY